MTTKLSQKAFLKGSREFEILDDAIYVRIKTPLKQEKLTVSLSTLNPEPVLNNSVLEFYGRTKNEPLLSLLVNKPTERDFNAFIDSLKQRILEEFNAFAGVSATSRPAELSRNVYEVPPEFDEPVEQHTKEAKTVRVASVTESIQMLETYVDTHEIKELLSALKALELEPESEACMRKLEEEFKKLGMMQGAVLTYAPYLSVLLADDPFGA